MYVSNLFFTSLLIYCLVSYFKCILIRFIVFSQFCVVNFFSQFIYTIDNKDKVMKYQIKYQPRTQALSSGKERPWSELVT